MEAEKAKQEDSKGKIMKPKTAEGKMLVHSGKKEIVNESDDEDENCVCIYCFKSCYQSKTSTTTKKKSKTRFSFLDVKTVFITRV